MDKPILTHLKMKDFVITSTMDPIAATVGLNKDSYHISTNIQLNTETNETKVECKVIKNYFGRDAQSVFIGTYQQCYNRIKYYILRAEADELEQVFMDHINGKAQLA